jgi:hypothetical protein
MNKWARVGRPSQYRRSVDLLMAAVTAELGDFPVAE